MNFTAGATLGKYVIRQSLARGGMSDVFLAHDAELDRDVVLKFPHAELLGDPKTHEHFQREVKIGKLLDHPNIQKLYELAGDAREPYLVLEFVPGMTLREELGRDDRKVRRVDTSRRIAETVDIGQQVARALAYAHALHVAHRDLKPENVIVTPEGHAKVMDFGVAFIEGARRVTWGALSAQVGTPDYMAPEQIKGVRGDHRTDIYALGVMLYEMIAMRLPYEGDNALAIMSQHVTENAPPLQRFSKETPQNIAEIIMKAIRRDPDDRWQTMDAFAAALEHPESVDVEALAAERATIAGSARPMKGLALEIGMPLWKLLLIVAAIFAVIISAAIVAQVVHPAH